MADHDDAVHPNASDACETIRCTAGSRHRPGFDGVCAIRLRLSGILQSSRSASSWVFTELPGSKRSVAADNAKMCRWRVGGMAWYTMDRSVTCRCRVDDALVARAKAPTRVGDRRWKATDLWGQFI